jgi:hypothetical protein
MVRSALFVGGNRKSGLYYDLALSSYKRPHLHVTAKALEAAGGISRVNGLSSEGVISENGLVRCPSIFLRVNNLATELPTRLLLTEDQLKAVSTAFKIKGAAEGSLFVRAEECFGPKISIAPDWPSLLNPPWRRDFFACLENPAPERVPRPNWLPWQTQSKFVELPGLPYKVRFEGEPLTGKFWISTVDGRTKLDLTRTNRDLLLSLLLRMTAKGLEVERLSSPRGLAEAATTLNESFNPVLLGKLMVPLAQLDRAKYYCFSKRVGKRDFRLTPNFPGNGVRNSNLVAKLVLNIGSGVPIEEGQLCHFMLVRQNRFLNVACYRDKVRERLLGLASYYLGDDGLAVNPMRTLSAPNGSIPDWLADVSGIMDVEVNHQ